MLSARSAFTGLVFSIGVVGSVATSGPAADVSGASDTFSVVLSADEPTASFTASAVLQLDSEATVTGGDIGLNVSADGDSPGSVACTLRSETTGQETTIDIVDTEAQGASRAGIDAFAGCATDCSEDLTIIFERTDTELEGSLGLSWSIDGLASTSVESTGTISFDAE